MDVQVDLKTLHPLEVRLLRAYPAGERFTPVSAISKLDLNIGQCNQAVSWLTAKGLLDEVERTTTVAYEVTGLGKEYQSIGTPEERILAYLEENGPATIPELADSLSLDNRDIGSAYGALSKSSVLQMDESKRVTRVGSASVSDVDMLRSLLDRAVESGSLRAEEVSAEERAVLDAVSRKRGASTAPFRLSEGDVVTYRVNEAGQVVASSLADAGITGEEIGQLTPGLLKSGEWKAKAFRAYNINVPQAYVEVGRRNPYSAYLDHVKDKLTALGFEQFDGSLVETEFWNSDALFMPQFHSARDIHDVYYLEAPTHAHRIEEPYLSSVAAAHENGGNTGSRGWQYSFDRDFTKRLILRSQGTAVSARTLPRAKIPGRYFGMLRCFRPDDVDATHLSDFYQTEGIVLSENVNLKTLLGLLEMFAREVAGATDVRYVPAYFPFTEPSVEVHIKHPVLGWFELGGSGIFRPEVTQPLGVDVPVLAWGLGIDRMALMRLGLDDLRELFSDDIQAVRRRRSG
jgi:phenylalanyl-tRNA synthetase alpha chain